MPTIVVGGPPEAEIFLSVKLFSTYANHWPSGDGKIPLR